MTISVDGLENMARILIEREATMAVYLEAGLGRVLTRIEKTAKSEFGHYQREVGPFPAWEELTDYTKQERLDLGFTENDPLERTGELRDSISKEQHVLEGAVGSTDERMVFHEFGTVDMPMRPVLGPAAFRNKAAIIKLVGAAVVSGIIGPETVSAAQPDRMGPFQSEEVHDSLGYNFTT